MSASLQKNIFITVTNDLVSDQRVHKVALSLLKSGSNITLIGRKKSNSLELISRPYNTKRFSLLFNKKVFFYANYNFRLFFYLLFRKVDILVANDLDSLLANYLISKIRKKTLVYDSHEYFTEVPELENRKKVKKIWTKLEKRILPKIKHSYTVCESIANIYNEKYGIDMKVVRNLPISINNSSINKDASFDFKNKKIILYQGAINKGRGLEMLINSMQYIENAVFVVIGNGDIINDLKDLVKDLSLEEKVYFKGEVSFEKLYNYTIKADLGVSLEENIGLSYFYSLPNKIFDYIHANVPVLVSTLPEMENILNTYNIGLVNKESDPKKLSEIINKIFTDDEKRAVWKQNLTLAAKELCWEKEENILIDIYKKAGLEF